MSDGGKLRVTKDDQVDAVGVVRRITKILVEQLDARDGN